MLKSKHLNTKEAEFSNQMEITSNRNPFIDHVP